MPRFSIIIPTFNRASVLLTAINSVTEQIHKDWELLIVDDGSTDNTRVVVESVLLDIRISYYWQENKELNAARNTGVSNAKGEYLCFLDDDDIFLPNHLAVLDQLIQSHNLAVAFYRTGMIVKTDKKKWFSPIYDSNQNDLLMFLWSHSLGIMSFAFHHTIFKQIKFDARYILADDLHFLLRVGIRYQLLQSKEYTVVYYKHFNARTNTYYQKHHLLNKLACLNDILTIDNKQLDSLKSKKQIKKMYANEYLYFSRAAFRHKEIQLALHYFLSSLSYFQIHNLENYLLTFLKGIHASLFK